MYTPLIELLKNYHPADPWEQQCKNRMLSFIAQHGDKSFDRTLDIGHFTASVWLLNNDHAHALLMHHAKLNIWIQPGGHCDGNPDILAVAIKEAQEESGIETITAVNDAIFDLDIHNFPAMNGHPHHLHYDVRFLLATHDNDTLIQNHESKGLRWFGKDRAALPTAETTIIRMFDKWLIMAPQQN